MDVRLCEDESMKEFVKSRRCHGFDPGFCLFVLTPCSRHFFWGDIECHVFTDTLGQILDRG